MSGDFTFLKGNIETIILCSLYNENKYGYEIAKEIKERTSNRYEIKQPTLYSYLKRLEEDDLIGSYWGETSNGGRRRYYSLTKKGRANCEQFISEWQYQRSVLSDLVDGTANGVEISQEEATPLFGRRSARRAKKQEFLAELDEQDEIARRLRELTGTPEPQEEETVEEIQIVEEEPVVEEIVEQIIEEEPAPQPEPEPEPIVEPEPEPTPESQPTVIERIVYVEKPVYIETVREVQSEEAVASVAEPIENKFEVKQDKAEDFMQVFDEKAREVSERNATDHAEGENYQHIIMGVIGDQLDGVERAHTDSSATLYYEDHPAALEDVADSLAKEGIRLRIYNHATATYKPKTLIPQSKVLCQAAWLTYAVAAIYFAVLTFAYIARSNSWSQFIVTLAVLLIVPIGFTAYAIWDPTRKDKPQFNYRVALIVTSVLCIVIILIAVALSALANLDFTDHVAVAKQILIPTGIAILLPVYVVIYETLYKKY